MAQLEKEILELLREQYIEVENARNFNTTMSSDKREYYLEYWFNNTFIPMDAKHYNQYNNGSGSELEKKMNALRSSSAMTYNALGNDKIRVKENPYIGKGLYSIEYEKQFRTLKTRGKPANLDAELYSEESGDYVFCEMKMLEYLDKGSELKNKYLDCSNYLIEYEDFKIFENVFNIFCIGAEPNQMIYKSNLKRYDAFQMIKHILGIYSALVNGVLKDTKRITLVNVVWELQDKTKLSPDCEELYIKIIDKEKEESKKFISDCEPIVKLFKRKNIAFAVKYLPFHEFLEILDLPDYNLDKLRRYLI